MDIAESPFTPIVLIVDDEPVNRMVLARMVEHYGARCVEAASGAEALELLGAQKMDLVLMDIHMPQMSGIQAVERLRAASGPNQQVPVVAVTGDTTRVKREYIALGFDDYANKPISLAAVRAMLSARREPASEALHNAYATSRR
jgi:CheY-like chemotaxis protein